ncbi:MAG: alanine racemase [Ilumatobacter coccineus]|uniref:Alanine racemase n=1 Tax=Ilumatobacter coccineus TaxID=467094 RepID=A0A2G6KAZ6_9ACTN|nr:MAG: alanine racemase [Ilumatobacter coccineus]
MSLRAWAEIDRSAMVHNIGVVTAAAPNTSVWAVVKANGYGHGAATAAQAALDAGADGLCVALTAEGIALRDAGIDAPILILSQQPLEDAHDIVNHHLIATVSSVDAARSLVNAGAHDHPVHLKVDTGMHRIGAHVADVADLVTAISTLAPAVRLEGIFTHLACADEPSSAANDAQLDRFDTVLADLDRVGGRPPIVHAANSAAAVALPRSRYDFIRVGIALYGISPGRGVDDLVDGLRPAMSLKARVSHVKTVVAGSSVSYGWRHTFSADTVVATVPIGYADGVPRRLGTDGDRCGADVLIGGCRCPIVGVVTMDQLVVDVGGLECCEVGDEVVLLGCQGSEEITALEWAERLGTIGYEIVCGVSERVPRQVVGTTANDPS